MKENERSIKRAEITLLVVFLLALLLPQIWGYKEEAGETGSETSSLIRGLEDVQDKTFALTLGGALVPMLPDIFPEASISYVNDWSEECLQVVQGKADAAIWEESSLEEALETYPELTALPEPIGELEYRWCTHKTPEGDKLLGEINTFIRSAKEEGLLEEIYARWADVSNAPDHVEDFPMTGTPQGDLHIVTCLDWQPVCYLNGDQACGFLIELLYRFCAFAGYNPVPEYVDIQSLSAGFNAGKYDLLAYGMVYIEEAAEIVSFTESLMSDPLYVLVRKDRVAAGSEGEDGKQKEAGERIPKVKLLLSNLAVSFERTFIREDRYRMLLSGLWLTFSLSVMSVLFGTILGGILCACRLSSRPFPNAFARIYIRTIQGMPIVLMLLILYYLVFAKTQASAFWVSVLGFSLDFAAYASEMFRSGILAVPPGQRQAASALGFSRPAAFLNVVFPQMVIHCLPVYIGQVISTVKLTSVAGYISVMELTKVSDLIRSRTYEAFFPLVVTALIYFLVACVLTLALKYLERRIDPAKRDRKIKGVGTHAS